MKLATILFLIKKNHVPKLMVFIYIAQQYHSQYEKINLVEIE